MPDRTGVFKDIEDGAVSRSPVRVLIINPARGSISHAGIDAPAIADGGNGRASGLEVAGDVF